MMRLKNSRNNRWQWESQDSSKTLFSLVGSYGLIVAVHYLFTDVSNILLSYYFFIIIYLELYHKLY